jgi:hypothetical protein
MDILSERPAPQAGSELFGFGGIIAFDSKNTVVLNMQAQRTSSPAVKGRGGADNFYIIIDIADALIGHLFLPTRTSRN